MTLFGFDVGSRAAKCFNSDTGEVEIVYSHYFRIILPDVLYIFSSGYFLNFVPIIFNLSLISSSSKPSSAL